ncbi:MAG TPA: LysR family transcriptional regulator [Gammaproteobacteria bacterium]|nr:LysR family transcriptional regulator [Gammaproteobacteria bacterium]
MEIDKLIDYNAMALFVRVAENRSFTRTARKLGMPISTLSRKIAELESQLGVRLLERSTRKLRLTELGQDYFGYCQRALQEFEAANLLVQDKQDHLSGRLRLSVPPSLEKCLVVPLVARFLADYPNVRIQIVITERKLDFFEDNIDMAFRVGEMKDSSLVARALIRYEHILVAAPSYLEAAGAPTYPAELEQHRLIAFNGSFNAATWTFTRGEETLSLQPDETLSLNDFVGAQYAAEQGLGIAEMPSIICGHALAQGRLVRVLEDWRFTPLSQHEVTLRAVYPSNRNLSRLVSLFRDHCVAHIDDVVAGARRGDA